MGKKITGASITLPAPFNATSSDPVDSRFVVETKSDLINKETFGYSGNYCYIYEGMPVYVSDEKATYTYMGPFVEGNGVPIEEGMNTLDNWVKTGDKNFNVVDIQNSITEEVNRAKAAEQKLTNDLNTEIIRSTNKDTELTNNLSAEITRATNAEKKLTDDLATEVLNRTNADTVLINSLNNEISRAQLKEQELTNDLTSEINRAITKENQLDIKKANVKDLSNILGEEVAGDELLKDLELTTIKQLKEEISNGVVHITPQTLTPEEQKQVKQNIGVSKMELFIDQWNTACGPFGVSKTPAGRYNTSTGFFELNGLTDISYEEALKIYHYSLFIRSLATNYPNKQWLLHNVNIRTNFPVYNRTLQENLSWSYGVWIDVFALYGDYYFDSVIVDAHNFPDCIKCLGKLIIEAGANKSGFATLSRLEEIQLVICESISFAASKSLSLASVSHLVTNAANTSPITITVHPDVYTKLTGDTTNAAAAALTADSLSAWQQVLTDATAKNISFATA